MGSRTRTRLGWCGFYLGAGLLCWLHVKFYAPSAVLALAGAWRLWREGFPHADNPEPSRPAVLCSAFSACYLTGPTLFWCYSIPAFGNIMGGRSADAELTPDLVRTIELVLGLHFDQIHGLFIQQPLLLPGLIGLGWMLRRRHPLTLPWLVLYASIVVPNALQRIPYGGHIAPAGRFGWSAMWLWLVPLGIWAQSLPATTIRSRQTTFAIRLLAGLGIAWSTALASTCVRLSSGHTSPSTSTCQDTRQRRVPSPRLPRNADRPYRSCTGPRTLTHRYTERQPSI